MTIFHFHISCRLRPIAWRDHLPEKMPDFPKDFWTVSGSFPLKISHTFPRMFRNFQDFPMDGRPWPLSPRLVEDGRPYRNDAMWQLHEDLVAAAAWERCKFSVEFWVMGGCSAMKIRGWTTKNSGQWWFMVINGGQWWLIVVTMEIHDNSGEWWILKDEGMN